MNLRVQTLAREIWSIEMGLTLEFSVEENSCKNKLKNTSERLWLY